MKITRTQVIITVLLIAGTAALTRYFFPRIETQTVDVIKEVVRTDIRTITKIIEKPDGTKETIIDHTDKSVENKDQKHTETKYAKADWNISASAGQDITNIQKLELVYGVHVQRRILGPFYLGGMADTSKRVGLSIGMEF